MPAIIRWREAGRHRFIDGLSLCDKELERPSSLFAIKSWRDHRWIGDGQTLVRYHRVDRLRRLGPSFTDRVAVDSWMVFLLKSRSLICGKYLMALVERRHQIWIGILNLQYTIPAHFDMGQGEVREHQNSLAKNYKLLSFSVSDWEYFNSASQHANERSDTSVIDDKRAEARQEILKIRKEIVDTMVVLRQLNVDPLPPDPVVDAAVKDYLNVDPMSVEVAKMLPQGDDGAVGGGGGADAVGGGAGAVAAGDGAVVAEDNDLARALKLAEDLARWAQEMDDEKDVEE